VLAALLVAELGSGRSLGEDQPVVLHLGVAGPLVARAKQLADVVGGRPRVVARDGALDLLERGLGRVGAAGSRCERRR
jgi:hypothetical protein